jgi:hypothetical protein
MKITIENTCAIKGALMLVLGTPEFEADQREEAVVVFGPDVRPHSTKFADFAAGLSRRGDFLLC